MFSSAFAGYASRGPKGPSLSSGTAMTVAEGNRRMADNSKRLTPILSGNAVIDDGDGGNNGNNDIASSLSKRKKKRRRSRKKRSPWLSAPMILGSEVASNIA